MKQRTKLFGIYLPFFILITVGAIVLRTIATVNYFNYEYGYFTSSALPAIANALIASAFFFFLIYIISTRARVSLIPNFSSSANYIPSSAVSASLVFMIIHLMKVFINEDSSISKWLALVTLIFAALSIVYFALNTIFIRTVSIRRANFGLCAIVFFGLYLAYLYFDKSMPINAPVKIVDQIAYVFASVFFLYEIRLSLGREKWRSYMLFAFGTAVFSAYSAIPALITYFVNGEVISNSIYESILTLSVFLFAVFKLFLTDKLVECKQSPIVTQLKAAAERRIAELHPAPTHQHEEEIPESTEESEVPDEKQYSILDIVSEENADTEVKEEINEEETEKEEPVNEENISY